jgi:hypothetical protein
VDTEHATEEGWKTMVTMELFGLLSSEDERAGFKLVLDEKYYVLLLSEGKVVATFDPRDYTEAELRRESADLIQKLRPK